MTREIGTLFWIISGVLIVDPIVHMRILDSLAKFLKRFSVTNAKKDQSLNAFPCEAKIVGR